MTATPLPETPSSAKTIPFNLYFHGLDKPHWSAELDGINPDPDAQRRAEKSRALVGSARRRRVAGLHDSIKRLERSVTQLNDLDETGLTDVAAQHIERRLANTISQCRSLLEDLNDATDSYRVYEHVATTPPPPEDPAPDADISCHRCGAGDENAEGAQTDGPCVCESPEEDFEAEADARAADQVLTALAARMIPDEGVPADTPTSNDAGGGFLRSVPAPPSPADMPKVLADPLVRQDPARGVRRMR